jgi:mRNA-degrading endonuclease RelE of RelBE toxin-antitoxin system
MRVVWGDDVKRRLRGIPAIDEAAIRAAVQRFGQAPGGTDSTPAEGSLIRRLRVGPYRVVMVLEPDGGVVWVVRLYRANANPKRST